MTPGLAFFYGGLVGKGATLSTMMLCVGSSAVITLLWALVGFSLAFGPGGTDVIGWADFATLDVLLPASLTLPFSPTVTVHAFAVFQMMFAIVACSILSGSVAGKMRWGFWLLFSAMWHLGVYCPLARWIFLPQGWLARYGVLDFAGGMVIHVSSGVSALVLAWLVGRKFPTRPRLPHNVPFVLLGAAMLWMGWFGFNAGSTGSGGYQAGLALLNTQLGAAAAMLTWNLMEVAFHGIKGLGTGRATAVGGATGTIAGLVAITPAAGLVSPMWAIFISVFSVACVFFTPGLLRRFLGVDDVLDCFAVHGVAGAVGAALTGLFANPAYSDAVEFATDEKLRGSFYGRANRVGIQCAGISITVLLAAVGTILIYGILWCIAAAIGSTVHLPVGDWEGMDVDAFEHGEAAYFSNSLVPARRSSPTGFPGTVGAGEGAGAGAAAAAGGLERAGALTAGALTVADPTANRQAGNDPKGLDVNSVD